MLFLYPLYMMCIMCFAQILWRPCAFFSASLWTECIKVQKLGVHFSRVVVLASTWLYPSCLTLCNRPAVNQELSNIFNELWRLDVNRWTPGVDYTISVQVQSRLFFRLHLNLLFFTEPFYWTVQGRAGFVSQGSHVVQDHASQPLFSNINENKLTNTTILSSKCLYNRQKY